MSDPEARDLPPEVSGFLVELAKALQQVGFYPAGHPSLAPIVDRIHRGLEDLLRERESLTLAVSPDTLATGEGESDPDHPALRGLAERLHEHELARVSFHPVPERDEVAGFLDAASARHDADEGPLGARRAAGGAWPHIDLEPATYDHLTLTEEAEEEPVEAVPVEEVEGEAEELWRGLARAALADAALEEADAGLPDVPRIVVALERYSADEARARTVAARMLDVARRLRQEGPDAAPEVRDRLERLLEETGSEALGRIFGAAPPSLGQAFLQATGEWMPVDTVLEMVEQVSGGRRLGLSYHMLRLLSKLADSVHFGEGGRDPEAERAFREQVMSLVDGWQRNIEAPDGGGRLPGSLGGGDGALEASRRIVEPERLVQTALEIDRLGPAGERAVDRMLEAGRVVPLLDLLREAPAADAARGAVWERVGTEASVRHLLRQEPPDFEALDDLLDHLGSDVAGPLLDALSESGSRSTRRQIFSRLVELEGEVDRQILRRLEDDRWFVRRNMLALLAERGGLPEGFSALPHTTHPRAAVRREAYRLALRRPEDREEAVRRGMEDDDPKVLSLVFGALERLPDDVLDALAPTLVRKAGGDDLSAELRRPGIRALARVDDRRALRFLLSLCRTRKPWTFWRTSLVEKGPLMLAALRALAAGWSDEPEAREVLERARGSADEEIRRAAEAGSLSPEAA